MEKAAFVFVSASSGGFVKGANWWVPPFARPVFAFADAVCDVGSAWRFVVFS